MAYTLSTLQTEFYSRGFAYLNDAGAGVTRATRWLNDANHEVDSMESWPYLMVSTTGASPITVTTLGMIETVLDTTNQNALMPSDRQTLLRQYGDLTTTGTAQYFYMNAGVITVFPVSTNTMTVNYYTVTADMSSGSDAPLMPDRFRGAIVERACAYAYRDQDDPQMAAVCLAEMDRIVARMRDFYALQTGAQYMTVTGASDDW